MTITVLYGGEGPEREVSLKSGNAVTSALAERGHDTAATDLRSRDDFFSLLGKRKPDFAFIALHGGWGEDGALQAALEMAGVPFSGSGHAACALAMDKTASKAIFRWKGIPAPKGIEVPLGRGAREVLEDPRFPPLLERCGKLVVKPCCSGSTVGVSVLSGTDNLEEALEEAFRYNPRVLVEEYVPGRELTVAVQEHEGEARTLPVVEIQPVTGFYDYSSKYTPGECEYIVPAPLSPFVLRRVEQAALAAHTALGCAAYSRVDLRLDEEGFPSVLEVNTVPGMTATSLVPKAAAAAGVSFGEFLEDVIKTSLAARR